MYKFSEAKGKKKMSEKVKLSKYVQKLISQTIDCFVKLTLIVEAWPSNIIKGKIQTD
jgi:hypothetical protein